MQEFFSLISNFGFPIVVAGYLLFRFENKIEKLDSSINSLADEVKELKNEIRRNGK